jgi:hypothetical protein
MVMSTTFRNIANLFVNTSNKVDILEVLNDQDELPGFREQVKELKENPRRGDNNERQRGAVHPSDAAGQRGR